MRFREDRPLNASTTIVSPPPELVPDLDLGIITSAYGPEEAGDLRDVVGHPPEVIHPKSEPPTKLVED